MSALFSARLIEPALSIKTQICCFSNFTCKYSRNQSTAIVFILYVAYLILSDDCTIINQDFCADYHLGKGSCFSHHFIFIPLYDNRKSKIYIIENSFIENLQYQNTVCGTERQTNVINKNVDFLCSEEVSCPVVWKCKQVCVSKLLSAREVMGTLNVYVLFFMCRIDMNKFFEKHLWPMKHVYSSCFVNYGFIINICRKTVLNRNNCRLAQWPWLKLWRIGALHANQRIFIIDVILPYDPFK